MRHARDIRGGSVDEAIADSRADADVREFLKDVSSFANTAGGHLIIGMDEAGGNFHELENG
jgi:predicted HTH transcriptional regulator